MRSVVSVLSRGGEGVPASRKGSLPADRGGSAVPSLCLRGAHGQLPSLQRPLPVPLHRLTAYLRRDFPPTQWQKRILSRALSSTSPVPTKTPPVRSRLQSSCSAGQLLFLPECPTYRRPLLLHSLRLTHVVWKQ